MTPSPKTRNQVVFLLDVDNTLLDNDRVTDELRSYLRRELDDVEARWPAEHYVLVDDKVRILTAVKEVWGERLTTVFPRQGHYAHDPDVATYPVPDLTIQRIRDLLDLNLPALLRAAQKEGKP
jgi:hypothetical protein